MGIPCFSHIPSRSSMRLYYSVQVRGQLWVRVQGPPFIRHPWSKGPAQGPSSDMILSQPRNSKHGALVLGFRWVMGRSTQPCKGNSGWPTLMPSSPLKKTHIHISLISSEFLSQQSTLKHVVKIYSILLLFRLTLHTLFTSNRQILYASLPQINSTS